MVIYLTITNRKTMPYSVQYRVQAYIPTKLESLKSEGSAINKQLRYNTNVQKCERV